MMSNPNKDRLTEDEDDDLSTEEKRSCLDD